MNRPRDDHLGKECKSCASRTPAHERNSFIIRYQLLEILRFYNLDELFHLLYFHRSDNRILMVDYRTCRLKQLQGLSHTACKSFRSYTHTIVMYADIIMLRLHFLPIQLNCPFLFQICSPLYAIIFCYGSFSPLFSVIFI